MLVQSLGVQRGEGVGVVRDAVWKKTKLTPYFGSPAVRFSIHVQQ